MFEFRVTGVRTLKARSQSIVMYYYVPERLLTDDSGGSRTDTVLYIYSQLSLYVRIWDAMSGHDNASRIECSVIVRCTITKCAARNEFVSTISSNIEFTVAYEDDRRS